MITGNDGEGGECCVWGFSVCWRGEFSGLVQDNSIKRALCRRVSVKSQTGSLSEKYSFSCMHECYLQSSIITKEHALGLKMTQKKQKLQFPKFPLEADSRSERILVESHVQ